MSGVNVARGSHRLLTTAVAVCLLLALVSCGSRRPKEPPPGPRPTDSPAPLTLDDEPAAPTLTLEDLEATQVLETHGQGGVGYRMRLSNSPLGTIRYYGLPVYPQGRGAELLSPIEGESEPPETGYVAVLVTPDEPAQVAAWYQERLPDWRVAELPAPNSEEIAESVLYQPPLGRRRICVSAAGADVGLTLIGYQVHEGETTPPLPMDANAHRKWEHVLSLGLALDQYRADTGEDAESVADLVATEGPEGYRGPYLAGEPPVDPYSGQPYEVEGGEIVGPGDVTRFSS